mmetsp:Transcript_30906/g.90345  ORF Transcript_30906/g.90345 Transcript_30906/m.90345 type:complete len:357 (+) Transcript_30906:920-1990(+)
MIRRFRIISVEVQITDIIRRGTRMVRSRGRGHGGSTVCTAVRGLVHIHMADNPAKIIADGEEVQVQVAQYVDVAGAVRPVARLVGLQPTRFDHVFQLRLVALLVPVEGGLEGVITGNDEVLDDALLRPIDDAAIFQVRGRSEAARYASCPHPLAKVLGLVAGRSQGAGRGVRDPTGGDLLVGTTASRGGSRHLGGIAKIGAEKARRRPLTGRLRSWVGPPSSSSASDLSRHREGPGRRHLLLALLGRLVLLMQRLGLVDAVHLPLVGGQGLHIHVQDGGEGTEAVGQDVGGAAQRFRPAAEVVEGDAEGAKGVGAGAEVDGSRTASAAAAAGRSRRTAAKPHHGARVGRRSSILEC